MSMDRNEFRTEIDRWPVPEPNLLDVADRGRSLRKRWLLQRAATGVACLAVLIGAFVFLPRILPDSQDAVRLPDQTAADASRDAKAVAFAFHALVGTGPYTLNYVDFTRADDVYRVRFLDGLPREELERAIAGQQDTIDGAVEQIRHARVRIKALQERLRRFCCTGVKIEVEDAADVTITNDRKRSLERKIVGLRRDVLSFKDARSHFRGQEEDMKAQLQEQIRTNGPHPTTLEVSRAGGLFHVTGLEGPMEEARRTAIFSFSETVPERTLGYEFYEPRIRTSKHGVSIEQRIFYVGPIRSQESVNCTTSLVDDLGRVIYASPRTDFALKGVATEDARDGGATTIGLSQERPSKVSPKTLQVVSECHPLRGGWWALPGTNIEPVQTGDTQEGSSFPLDPERHVFVRVTIAYQGAPFIGSQSICIASAYGRSGELLDTHGLTIYGPYRESDLRRLDNGRREIRIAVDVGDPDAVGGARVECHQTAAGEVGPDRPD